MFFFTSQWHAQKIVRSSIGAIGSSVSANGILSQQIVGQPGITTHEKSKNGLGLRQGFIQPSWFKTESNELNVVLFPNPNQGDFSFQAEIPEKQYYNYEVMDNNGKLVLKGKGMGIERINISLQNPSPSMYHLNVFTKDQNSAFQINVIN
tara:strand:- start:1331 stop:1780 length:450 start_codon:yes stop_codon:yes gene_type:complete